MRVSQGLALLLLAVLAAGLAAGAQSAAKEQKLAQETQAREFWVDPATGLMWTAKDNGKDVSWKGAKKYCRKLRLAGYDDWRLATIAELEGIYYKKANAPGLAVPRKAQEEFTFHVKGGLFLTGDEWGGHPVSGRMPIESYEYYFDFNEGRSDDEPSGWPYSDDGMRALCVRGSGK